jgi:hypothetical protein
MALSEASYLIYGVARSLLGVARMDVGKLIELLILCIILCILGIILGILCILLGIILGISRILGINISELSKRDPNHKKKNLDPYNKTNESVFQSTRRIDLVLRNYHQGHAEIEDANG